MSWLATFTQSVEVRDEYIAHWFIQLTDIGNGFDFTMTYADARSSECSSCPIKQDLSNYWTPSLYYMAENGTFESVVQSGSGDGNYGGMTVYYL